jgi:hypothetical protein
MGYYDSLPPSFGQQVFVNEKGAELTNAKFGSSLDSVFSDPAFGVDTAGEFNQVAENLTGFGALAGDQAGWTFITAPEDVSWDIANQANRVDIFGTNNPPVVAGSRGMRDLTLGNALVEGFVRNVSVEGKVAALEQLMNYGLNSSDGYVSVPVYQVWANEKSYGGPDAYYIIKDIKVKEAMRDLKGNSTRAYVDISLMQVPAYQVGTGRDQASQVTAGGVSVQQTVGQQGNQQMQGPASKGGTPATNPASKPPNGPSVGASQPAKPSASTAPRVTITGSGQPEIKYVGPPKR